MSEVPAFLLEKFLSYSSERNSGYSCIDKISISQPLINKLLDFLKQEVFHAHSSLSLIKSNYLFDDILPAEDHKLHISLNYPKAGSAEATTSLKRETIKIQDPLRLNQDPRKPILQLQKGNVLNKIFITLVLDDNKQLLEFKDPSVSFFHISVAHFYYKEDFGDSEDEYLERINIHLNELVTNNNDILGHILEEIDAELRLSKNLVLEKVSC